MSKAEKAIILKALRIRQAAGEDPVVAILGYTRLSDDERAEILSEVSQDG